MRVPTQMRRGLRRRWRLFLTSQWRVLVLSAVVGVVAGLGAVGFYTLLEGTRAVFLNRVAGYRPAGAGGEAPLFSPGQTPFRRWVLFLLPAAGGLVGGLIVYRFAPEAEGHGTDAAIEAYHQRGGVVRGRVPLVKAVTAAITIGTGGSAGREGPIAQIGSGFGSVMARWLNLRPRDRRVLMMAGMAAGIGAIFHAPMAGALFAAEVLYRDPDMEFEVIIPGMIASILAYSVFGIAFGWHAVFVTPSFAFDDPRLLLPYGILAVVLAAFAVVYIRAFYGVRDVFHRSRVPRPLRPAVGGLLTGCFAFFLPEAMGTGYDVLQQAVVTGTALTERFGSIGAGMLFAVAIGKIATTAFSVGSGGSGGIFGPAVVIGGALGGGTGMALQRAMPWLTVDPGAFTIVGMAGFFAAAGRVPLSTIIMISEMTGNYNLLVPAMWVCFLAYAMVRRHTLYEKQLGSRAESPAHLRNMAAAMLRSMTVRDVCATGEKPPVILPETPLGGFIDTVTCSELTTHPVCNADGRLVGLIYSRDLRTVLPAPDALRRTLVADDLCFPPLSVSPGDSVLTAVGKMRAHDIDHIAVVDADSRLLGMVGMRDVARLYDRQLSASTPTEPGAPAEDAP